MTGVARILVVDDNRDNRKLMEYLLRAHGYEPLTASSGSAGVRMAVEEQPDLILMDIQMPEMDGFEAGAEIRRRARGARHRIVAVTAFAMVGDRERMQLAGFDGYMTKPIDPRRFIAEIEGFLPERSSHRPRGER